MSYYIVLRWLDRYRICPTLYFIKTARYFPGSILDVLYYRTINQIYMVFLGWCSAIQFCSRLHSFCQWDHRVQCSPQHTHSISLPWDGNMCMWGTSTLTCRQMHTIALRWWSYAKQYVIALCFINGAGWRNVSFGRFLGCDSERRLGAILHLQLLCSLVTVDSGLATIGAAQL